MLTALFQGNFFTFSPGNTWATANRDAGKIHRYVCQSNRSNPQPCFRHTSCIQTLKLIWDHLNAQVNCLSRRLFVWDEFFSLVDNCFQFWKTGRIIGDLTERSISWEYFILYIFSQCSDRIAMQKRTWVRDRT